MRMDEELLTLNAFRLLKSDDGKRILQHLKDTIGYEKSCYSPSLPPENTFFRDGQKNVITYLEFMLQNLDEAITEKMQELNDGDSGSYTSE